MNRFLIILSALLLSATASASGMEDCSKECSTELEECTASMADDAVIDCQRTLNLGTVEGASQLDSCVGQHVANDTEECSKEFGACSDTCDELYGSGTAGRRAEPESCPGGSQLSELGTCSPLVGDGETDVNPYDGCPAGHSPGPDGACVPDYGVLAADLFSTGSGQWYLTCPSGTKPGPVGGCTPDLSEHTAEPTAGCPDGFGPGPDDGCMPDRSTWAGRAFLASYTHHLTERGLLGAESAPKTLERLAAMGVTVSEPEADVEALAAPESW